MTMGDIVAKNRYINTHFWDDTYIIELDPTEKLLFIYLLSNPLTNICGIYEIPIKRIAFDTGIDKEMAMKVLGRFDRDGKVKYDMGWLAIKNFLKHQAINTNIQKGINESLKEVPKALKKWVFSKAFQSLSKPSNYLNLNSNMNLNSNLNTNLKECETYKDSWNKLSEEFHLSKISILTKSRIQKIDIRIKEDSHFEEHFYYTLDKIRQSKFLRGDNKNGWRVSFDWLFINDKNYIKVCEGNYDDRKGKDEVDMILEKYRGK